MDAEQRRAFGMAMRTLAHSGDRNRVLLITHHEDLAETGDAQVQVVKGPAGSTVSQIA
jgi:DNA repair ATPase RecN